MKLLPNEIANQSLSFEWRKFIFKLTQDLAFFHISENILPEKRNITIVASHRLYDRTVRALVQGKID